MVDRGEAQRVWLRDDNALRPVMAKDLGRYIRPDVDWIVYKLHGSLDRTNAKDDWYLITEQDYVDFLGRSKSYIPPAIELSMRERGFLFIGYSLADWNVRVLLHKLRALGPRTHKDGKDRPLRSWAIRKKPSEAERAIWTAHGVNVYDVEIEEFVQKLSEAL